MKPLMIIKIGSTFPQIAAKFGDFDDWTRRGLGLKPGDTRVVDAEAGDPLPPPDHCAGVVVLGSHAMVTDGLPWSLRLERWIPTVVAHGVPVLGICYGHQLLASALGGRVDYHAGGIEIGTVTVHRKPAGDGDALFRGLPERFLAHAAHSQTVIALPDGAVHLAGNAFEPHHGFRIGERAWGVQFHPEYDAAIMAAYVTAMADPMKSAGRDADAIRPAVRETPHAARILRRFGKLAETFM